MPPRLTLAGSRRSAQLDPTNHVGPRHGVRMILSLIALYVLLWGFEGALRKWVPSSANILYFTRDAIILGSLFLLSVTLPSGRRTIWKSIFWIFALFLLCMAALSVISENNTLTAALIGVRAYIAPLFLILLVAQYAEPSALRTIRTAMAIVVLANLPIAIIQVTSPVSALINLQVGGSESIFVNGGTTVRASGTFSAPAGIISLVGLGTALSMGGIAERSERRLQTASLIAVLALAVLSGSRGAILQASVIVGVFLLVFLLRGTLRSAAIALGTFVAIGSMLLVTTLLFPVVVAAFQQRFVDASIVEDTPFRIFNDAVGFLNANIPILGDGPGTHQIGAVSVVGGQWIEVETIRWTAELGIFGFALALLKILVAIWGILFLVTRYRRVSTQTLTLITLLTYTMIAGSLTQQPTVQGGVAILLAATWLTLLNERGASTPDMKATPARTSTALRRQASQGRSRR